MSILPEFLGGTPEVNYAEIVFGGDIRIDGYQFPDGEIRYGIQSAPGLVGLGRTYLSDLQRGKTREKKLKVLLSFGFQARQIRQGKVVRRDRRGSSIVETISGSDLDAFVRFAAEHLKKDIAIALLGASFSEVRYDREASSFGLAPKTTPEKQRDFVLEVDRVRIANARASLDTMSMDDNYQRNGSKTPSF